MTTWCGEPEFSGFSRGFGMFLWLFSMFSRSFWGYFSIFLDVDLELRRPWRLLVILQLASFVQV